MQPQPLYKRKENNNTINKLKCHSYNNIYITEKKKLKTIYEDDGKNHLNYCNIRKARSNSMQTWRIKRNTVRKGRKFATSYTVLGC